MAKFQKGVPRSPRAGRKKGTKNKFTNAKQEFIKAFEILGGADFIVKVAKKRGGAQTVLKTFAQLIPKTAEVSGPDGGPIQASLEVKVTLVEPKKDKEQDSTPPAEPPAELPVLQEEIKLSEGTS